MTEFQAPRARSVDPAVYPPLRSFECGAATDYERVVDKIARGLVNGPLAVRVAEDSATGTLLGVHGYRALPLGLIYQDAAYIGLIAVAAVARGQRIGDFLLRDALSCVHSVWGGLKMPPVWGLVHPDNANSQRLMERHGFTRIVEPRRRKNADEQWVRPRGVPL